MPNSKQSKNTKIISKAISSKAYIKNNVFYYRVPLSIQEFSDGLSKNTVEVIKYFFNKGRLIHINNNLTEDEVIELCLHFGIDCELLVKNVVHNNEAIKIEAHEKIVNRAPIITIMGHVDHGKTTLLDFIRKTNVISQEVGGITQKIGAYQVEYNKNKITFIDTPGHEAFTKMRAKGARITDIAIIVVAADDGLKPQSKEAIDHARIANLQIIVAINKVDKPDADVERVKNELASYDLMPEEWGGKTMCIEISAKTGKNVDKLMDAILLLSEVLELKSTNDGFAQGTIIESSLSKNAGPLITTIIQKGKLKLGDFIVCGIASGRVKAIYDSSLKSLREAKLSEPVQILGLNNIPDTGIMFSTFKDEKSARDLIKQNLDDYKSQQLDAKSPQNYHALKDKIQNLIIKADSQGSIEAIENCLSGLTVGDIKINILNIKSGVINNSDIDLAITSNSLLIGFNIRPTSNTREYAKSKAIEIKLYNIIYQLLDAIVEHLEGSLPKEYTEIVTGEAIVREVFAISKLGNIAGCFIRAGEIKLGAKVRVIRNNKTVIETTIETLKHFKKDVTSLKKDNDCGIYLKNFQDLKADDILETFELQEQAKNSKVVK